MRHSSAAISHRYEVNFFTATILEWKHLLKPDKYKDLICSSLLFLTEQNRVQVHGLVILSSHIHIVWHIAHPYTRGQVQRDFLKFTGQQIKQDLIVHHPNVLPHFYANAKDRHYQFWERNALSVPIWNEVVLLQKLNYIHLNPVRAVLCMQPEDYYYRCKVLSNGCR
jgi:putative transposase